MTCTVVQTYYTAVLFMGIFIALQDIIKTLILKLKNTMVHEMSNDTEKNLVMKLK